MWSQWIWKEITGYDLCLWFRWISRERYMPKLWYHRIWRHIPRTSIYDPNRSRNTQTMERIRALHDNKWHNWITIWAVICHHTITLSISNCQLQQMSLENFYVNENLVPKEGSLISLHLSKILWFRSMLPMDLATKKTGSILSQRMRDQDPWDQIPHPSYLFPDPTTCLLTSKQIFNIFVPNQIESIQRLLTHPSQQSVTTSPSPPVPGPLIHQQATKIGAP